MSQMLGPGSDDTQFERPAAKLAVDLRPMVKEQVVPLLHRAVRERIAPSTTAVPMRVTQGSSTHDEDVALLVHFLLDRDEIRIFTRLEAIRAEGRGLCEIYLKLLAPAAARLRDLWRDDLCGLADVTLGLCCLHAVLRHYAAEFYGEAYKPETGLRALLAMPVQSESTADMRFFSVLMLSEFFRRDGWDAWIERSFSSGRFRETVLSGWFDLVEIIVTSDKELDEVASGIRFIRRGSRNPQVGIIVCGDVFRSNPDFVRLVGADLMATDPLSSLSHANDLMSRPIQRRRLS